jgi:hypothetical protein
MIGYSKNQKEMEEAVEDSCIQQGDINRVWLVRNKKTIYREEKGRRRKKMVDRVIFY